MAQKHSMMSLEKKKMHSLGNKIPSAHLSQGVAMKTYTTKSVLIARKKRLSTDDDDFRPCFISLFYENNPHLSTRGPKEVVEFPRVHKVVIEGLKVDYLLLGNDLVINNLTKVEVEERNYMVIVRGVQQ